ncbi:MAG: flagellar M-ring protein FliF [Gammaproteobacteria bacterium]|nr:MAG: flagellar M-ring protein FliF [Pseudomonadota bacterium]PIE38114.1 MAG: flagellar M-ring protein FliF [Gammaproteobacteria bacterium]
MASVPAEVNDVSPAESGDGSLPVASESQNDMLLGFNKLTLIRQIGLMVGLAASVALGLAVVLWAQDPDYQPLIANLQNYDANEISTILDENNIGYKVDPKTGILLVESQLVYQAKLKLAAAGIKDNNTVGYELLDQEQGLGTSQFMEATRFRRGLEGELSRTIASMRNIRKARVHLAIPRRSVFVRDRRKSSASVYLEVYAGRDLSQEQVRSVVNLVANSVPEMDKKNVSVVDQRGRLLTGDEMDTEAKMASREFDYTRKLEEVLNRRVTSILEPVMGVGHFRSEVSADIDFTAIETAEEIFNPDLQALRSEQTVDEQRVSGRNGGIPGALSNQPPGAASVPEVAAGGNGKGSEKMADIRKQATRNYEVDRTISYSKQQQGRIKRLTVAVVVDDIRKVNPESGEISYSPWPEAELERLTILVRNAVGYSARRGDSVSVINSPFAPEEVVPFEEPEFWQQSWFLNMLKPVLAFLVMLVIILGMVRPTLKSLSSNGAHEKELALAGDEEGLATLDELESSGAVDQVSLGDSGEFLLPGASEGYDKQLNALKGLIAEDPARVAQVVRQWVNADE